MLCRLVFVTLDWRQNHSAKMEPKDLSWVAAWSRGYREAEMLVNCDHLVFTANILHAWPHVDSPAPPILQGRVLL